MVVRRVPRCGEGGRDESGVDVPRHREPVAASNGDRQTERRRARCRWVRRMLATGETVAGNICFAVASAVLLSDAGSVQSWLALR